MSAVIGFSVFRRTRKGKKTKRYTIELRMADGTKQRHAGFTDKGATQERATQIVRAIERKEVGLHDPFAKSRTTPLGEHALAFLRSMEAGTLGGRRRGRPSEEWMRRAKKRLAFLFGTMRATRLEHLNVAEAEELFAGQLKLGWSAKTRDDHGHLLRQFGNWLVDDGRSAANPFHRLRPIRDGASKTFRRHALTIDELVKLVEAAEVRGLQQGVRANPWMRPHTRAALQQAGFERGVLYQLAAYTGLRRGEILQLQWGDLRFGDDPAIQVRAETTKSRQAARLEVPRWLAALLEGIRKARIADSLKHRVPPGDELVFRCSYIHVTERLRLDALFARIGTQKAVNGRQRVVADDQRVIDFHALRGTLATLAAEFGMPTKLLQQHMRHSDVRLTMEVYAQVRSQPMRDAIEALPAVGQRRGQ